MKKSKVFVSLYLLHPFELQPPNYTRLIDRDTPGVRPRETNKAQSQ